MADHGAELCRALLVGGDLSLEVGNVLRRVARGVGGFGEKLEHGVLAEAPPRDQLEGIDIDPFLLDAGGPRAHRAGGDPADIGMMPARGDEKEKVGAVLAEDRRDHGNVGEMRAAVIRRVEHIDVAGLELLAHLPQHGSDASVH